MTCVECGLSVELHRTARHHAEGGYWGDLMAPVVVKQGSWAAQRLGVPPGPWAKAQDDDPRPFGI
jgi:hypothetical protein